MRKQQPRNGFSLVELQVALVVLAIAVAGICPLVVMQSKHLKKIEDRFNDKTTYYLVPSTDEWARKLGAAASIKTEDPGPPPTPPVVTIDDEDPGFSRTMCSGWTYLSSVSSYQGDRYHHDASTNSHLATWQFTGVIPGWYDVRITWLELSNRATNSPFTVYDGSVSKGTFTVNQQLAPSGAVFGGRPWQSLGIFPIKNDTMKVEVNDNANGRVIADGARLVAVRNDVQVTSIEKSLAQLHLKHRHRG